MFLERGELSQGLGVAPWGFGAPLAELHLSHPSASLPPPPHPTPQLSAALMFDAVHVVVSAVRELNRSQEIGVKPLACTSANIWPHGTSLMNYLRMVSREQGGPRWRGSLPPRGVLTVSIPPALSPHLRPRPHLLLSLGLTLPSVSPLPAFLCLSALPLPCFFVPSPLVCWHVVLLV